MNSRGCSLSFGFKVCLFSKARVGPHFFNPVLQSVPFVGVLNPFEFSVISDMVGMMSAVLVFAFYLYLDCVAIFFSVPSQSLVC